MYQAKKVLQCYYVQVADIYPNHQVSLQEVLEDLADFGSLTTSKAVSRLELLQSPTCTKHKVPGVVPNLKRNDFELLPTEGNDGCGFICEELLKEIGVQIGVGSKIDGAPVERMITLQVRVVIPALGIFKGQLMKKRIPAGQARIQLTPSMQKVGASRKTTPDDRAFLWVTNAGVSPSEMNIYMERLLNPSLKPPPKSFDKLLKQKSLMRKLPKHETDETEEKKNRGSMILDLWMGLGVTKDACADYNEKSKKRDGVQHSYVVGVADPTHSLPPGTVFVPGLQHVDRRRPDIFVTRSPCILPEDGRLISQNQTKPASVSVEDWEWLNNLPFGVIIFADAAPGVKPLPFHIAGGDLDGDRYFVCWSDDVLDQMDLAEPIVDIPESTPNESAPRQYDPNWLEKAQNVMLDIGTIINQFSLISELWNLSKKVAKDEPEGARHPDARAFGAAFHHALDIAKHGGQVPLPAHLHGKLPEALRGFLCASS